MVYLNTGWKHWDKFLSEYVGKKINCLELGSYKGDATCWMLNNLCTNKSSKVYSVDTWKGSPEYINVDFDEVEKIFDENVKKTGRSKQNVKMKMNTETALHKLKYDYIYFDIIFIDASHEAKDVLKDAILAWDILNEDGTLIFDDYKWDKLNQDYFCPKIAIDSFVHIYTPQIVVLYVGYQYIVKKKTKKHFEQPKLSYYYELIQNILDLPYCEMLYKLDDEIGNLEYDLILSNKEPEYEKKYGYTDEYGKIMNNDNINDNETYFNYDFNRLLLYYEDFDMIYKSVSEEIKKQMIKHNFDPYKDLKELYNYWGQNLENGVFETIMQIKLNNIIPLENKKLYFLNFSHSHNHADNKIKKFINLKLNVTDVEYIDINDSINRLYNYEDIEKIKLKNKVDIILISLTSGSFVKKVKKLDYEKYYATQLFNCVLFSLTNQNINGCSAILGFTFMTKASIDILTIIKKYYKNIYFTCYNSSKKTTTTTKIIASEFLGISNSELKELIKLSNKISSELKQYDNYDNANDKRFIHNIIKNNNNEKFINKIVKYSIERNNLTMTTNKVWQDLIKFVKKNEHLKNKVKNFIYTVQLQNFFWWFTEYKIKFV